MSSHAWKRISIVSKLINWLDFFWHLWFPRDSITVLIFWMLLIKHRIIKLNASQINSFSDLSQSVLILWSVLLMWNVVIEWHGLSKLSSLTMKISSLLFLKSFCEKSGDELIFTNPGIFLSGFCKEFSWNFEAKPYFRRKEGAI